MLPERVQRYIYAALEGTPTVVQALLGRYESNSPVWDRRPDPARFTLREVVAHLADWDEIFLERLSRTVDEDNPTLPDMDEGELAAARDYAHQDPLQNLARFSSNRIALLTFARKLSGAELARPALRPEIGPLTAEQQLLMIVGHDGYHTRQAAEFTAG